MSDNHQSGPQEDCVKGTAGNAIELVMMACRIIVVLQIVFIFWLVGPLAGSLSHAVCPYRRTHSWPSTSCIRLWEFPVIRPRKYPSTRIQSKPGQNCTRKPTAISDYGVSARPVGGRRTFDYACTVGLRATRKIFLLAATVLRRLLAPGLPCSVVRHRRRCQS